MKNVFKIEPPKYLYEEIVSRIREKSVRSAKRKVAFFTVAAFASLMAVVLTFTYVLQGFSSSGFYNYFSLLFSDAGVVLLNWKEFSLSLVESFPLADFTAFLLMLFMLLGSVRLILKNISIFNKSKYGY